MKKNPFLQSIHILMPLILDIAFSHALVMLGRFVLTIIISKNKDLSSYYINNSSAIAVMIDAVATLLLAILFYFMYRAEWPEALHLSRITPVLLILSVTLSLFLNTIFDYLNLTNVTDYKSLSAIQYSVPLPLGIFIYGFIKPVEEELVYRGLFYERMKKIFPAYLSVPVCSLVFGFLHGNLTQFVYAFLMGLLLAWVKEKEKNLLPCILIHSAANTFIFTSSSVPSLFGIFFSFPSCVICGILSVFAIIYLYVTIYWKQGGIRNNDPETADNYKPGEPQG